MMTYDVALLSQIMLIPYFWDLYNSPEIPDS